MKHAPIEPMHIGCGCCTPVGHRLDKEGSLDVGFGIVTLMVKYRGGRCLLRNYVGGLCEEEDFVTQVKHLEEEYGDRMTKAECTTLFFNTPLHDETYEYNKDDKQWYLIAQGMGFA